MTENLPASAALHDDLKKTNDEISRSKAESDKLGKKIENLESQKNIISKRMVKIAASLQASEARLSAIEEKIRVLNLDIEEKTERLNKRRKELSLMVRSAIKLSQTPKEAVIFMPGDMDNNIKAARALKIMTKTIRNESIKINSEMIELNKLKNDVEKKQEEAEEENSRLNKQKKLLAEQMSKYKKLQNEIKAEKTKIDIRLNKLAKKAKNLKNLIVSLEKEEERKKEELRKQAEYSTGDSSLRSFTDAKGKIRVPAAGRLIQKYGSEKKNGKSKGIIILTRPDAQVTSPYDGEVIFSGKFMEYGNMVILKHKNNYHTLIAGLDNISTTSGEFLMEGEPIGEMGKQLSNRELYMELRHNNKPVNPASWIREMSR
ncbi:MAG: peptidoglycan DD-metalloendopeptidase family protein [Rickettsiales bacterium]